jgi:hypothetical protein
LTTFAEIPTAFSMKKLALLILIFLASDMLKAQGDSLVVSPDFLSQLPATVIEKFDYSRESDYILYFPMKYAKFLFNDNEKKILENISDTIVERIDLVYTVFKRDKNFNQVKLNRERYEMLLDFFPKAFSSNLIEWRLVAQDGSMKYETAKDFFHGFVIYIKPHRVTTVDGQIISSVMDRRIDAPGSKVLTTNEEIEKIKSAMKLITSKVPTKTVKERVVVYEEKKVWTGYYLHHNPAKRSAGKKFNKPGKGKKARPKEYYTKKVPVESFIDKEVPDPDAVKVETKNSKEIINKMTTDSVVTEYFSKNESKWKDYVMVQDVTGSMYPYLTQTLLYLKEHMNSTETEKFVFFNDGDNKPDGVIGNTGGCYYVSSTNYDDIEKTAFTCMAAGKGGKAPENDIEAILYGYSKFPNSKGAVLIADNYSRVRDMSIIMKLIDAKKPVDIVICGAGKNGDVNLDYIYIARATGGTIHTLGGSYIDLKSKKEGEIFKIGAQEFKIEGKSVRLIKQEGW